MEAADWATSSVVFVVAISVALVMSSYLVSKGPPPVPESQLKNILESVSDEIQVRSLILKSDCNPALYDCNREYPIEVGIKPSRFNMLSKSFTQDENKLYSVMPLGSIAKLYSLPQKKITPSYPDTQTFTLSSDINIVPLTDSNKITVTNQYLNATITDENAIVDFNDSAQQDLIVSFPRMYMARLKDTNTSVVVGNDANSFYLRFFPNSAEFWVDVPDDINVSINPIQKNWKVDENIGVFSKDAWWDDDNTDAYWWHYRIPITVNSLDYPRQDLNMQVDINFSLERRRLGIAGLIVDPNSFRLVEYKNHFAYDATTATNDDSLALQNQPFEVTYNSNTEMAQVKWTLTGATSASAIRFYYLYFDFNNFPKPAYSYTAISYTPPAQPVYITIAFPQGQSETHIFDTNKAFIYNANTILLNVLNQLSRTWLYTTLGYRKPLLFDAGILDRNALMVSTDINFVSEFSALNCTGCDLNTASLSFVEVNNWDEGSVLKTYTYSDQNTPDTYNFSYSPDTNMMSFAWYVPATPALTKRYFFLYYNKLS